MLVTPGSERVKHFKFLNTPYIVMHFTMSANSAKFT